MPTEQATQLLGQRAIVIGAGMGGLMAAGVLARYFAEVMILDKDRLPTSAEPRSGAPQGAHAHLLLVQGRRNIEKIFPGFTSDVIDAGAITARFGLEFHVRDWFGWWPKRDIGLSVVSMTRPLLEGTVRSHLTRNGRITLRDGVTVNGWREIDEKIELTIAGEDVALTADFVIDAGGRSGQTKRMLEVNGYGPIEETVMGIGEAYASALFEIPPGWNDASHSFTVYGAPPVSHTAFMFPVESGRWLCSLNGRFDEAPPKDPEGFMAFAKNLSDPCIHNRISQAKQLGPIRAFNPTYSRWRRYDKLENFPHRLAPLGDAIAMVNPIYGQGMSLASAHAICLWETLADCANSGGALDGAVSIYLGKTQGITKQVWSGLEVVDFKFEKTTGERPADIIQRQAFSDALRVLAAEDAEVHRLIMHVNQLVDPGSVLHREDITAKVQTIMAQRGNGG